MKLLASRDSPVVDPKDAATLAEFGTLPEPPLPDRGTVGMMIASLAVATAQPKVSEGEAAAQLDMYWLALRDIPADDLRRAFRELVRTCIFLPKPAEVRTAALMAGAPRRHAKSRARFLAWKHRTEWRPPFTPVPPAEALALIAGIVSGATSAMRAPEAERAQ